MKIVVVSDNHGRMECLREIPQLHRDADAFIHCGDSELPAAALQGYVSVRGNNDFAFELPDMKVLELQGQRIMIVHGHRHLYMGQPDMLISKARRQGCGLVFYGHTHVFSWIRADGIHLINPGSLSHNRDGSDPSYAVVTLEGNDVSVQRINWNPQKR